MSFWSRIFRPEQAKRDLDAEIESHLALAAADKRDRGVTAEAARREAEREFGNAALVKDVARSIWGWVWLESAAARHKASSAPVAAIPGVLGHGDRNAGVRHRSGDCHVRRG